MHIGDIEGNKPKTIPDRTSGMKLGSLVTKDIIGA
jgi:hypothetical protein